MIPVTAPKVWATVNATDTHQEKPIFEVIIYWSVRGVCAMLAMLEGSPMLI